MPGFSIKGFFGTKNGRMDKENSRMNQESGRETDSKKGSEKVFEDYFSQLQADMTQICLDYTEGKAEKLFIYCSCEDNVIAADFFCRINGKTVKKHKLNDARKNGDPEYDVSLGRQKTAVNALNEKVRSVRELCLQYHRDMPTQIKLVYDAAGNKLRADYAYEPILGKKADLTIHDVIDAWYQEMQQEG